jgi:hypothetical protein
MNIFSVLAYVMLCMCVIIVLNVCRNHQKLTRGYSLITCMCVAMYFVIHGEITGAELTVMYGTCPG